MIRETQTHHDLRTRFFPAPGAGYVYWFRVLIGLCVPCPCVCSDWRIVETQTPILILC